jgi:hypothetical protein
MSAASSAQSTTVPRAFDRLPNELLVAVLRWLPLRDVRSASGVSRRWRDACADAIGALEWADLCP